MVGFYGFELTTEILALGGFIFWCVILPLVYCWYRRRNPEEKWEPTKKVVSFKKTK